MLKCYHFLHKTNFFQRLDGEQKWVLLIIRLASMNLRSSLVQMGREIHWMVSFITF